MSNRLYRLSNAPRYHVEIVVKYSTVTESQNKDWSIDEKNALAHPHDTRYKNKKATKRPFFTHSPIPLSSQNRTLALLNSTAQSPSKHSPTKKTRSGEHTVGCCICGPKSMCSTKKRSCQKRDSPVSLVNQIVKRILLKLYLHPQKLLLLILPTSRKRKRKIQYRKLIQENVVLYLLGYPY